MEPQKMTKYSYVCSCGMFWM